MTISKLLKERTPFAVMQYFESLKSLKSQTNKAYELIYVNDKKKLAYKLLTEREIYFVKSNPKVMKIVLDNKDGRVYEYNNFKQYKEENVIVEIPTLTFKKKEMEEYIESLNDKTIRDYFMLNVFESSKIPKERSLKFIECLKEFGLVYESKSKSEKDGKEKR